MKAIVLLALLPALYTETRAASPPLWINEFHYDNAGTDVGEFVEIAAPAGFTDLASVRLTLYNGGDGRTYGSAHLLDSFSQGQTVDGITFYSKLLSGMQNGAPDGMSLDLGGNVLHFLSYEGSFTASAGPAAGLASVDTGVFELDTDPPGGSLGLIGTGMSMEDFVWGSAAEATPGGLNHGQTLVPEPRPVALALTFGLVLWLRRHLRRGGPTPAAPRHRRARV